MKVVLKMNGTLNPLRVFMRGHLRHKVRFVGISKNLPFSFVLLLTPWVIRWTIRHYRPPKCRTCRIDTIEVKSIFQVCLCQICPNQIFPTEIGLSQMHSAQIIVHQQRPIKITLGTLLSLHDWNEISLWLWFLPIAQTSIQNLKFLRCLGHLEQWLLRNRSLIRKRRLLVNDSLSLHRLKVLQTSVSQWV